MDSRQMEHKVNLACVRKPGIRQLYLCRCIMLSKLSCFFFSASSSCGPGAAALGATSQSTGGVPRSLAGTGETQDPRDPRRQRAGNDSEMMEMEIVRLSLFQKIGV